MSQRCINLPKVLSACLLVAVLLCGSNQGETIASAQEASELTPLQYEIEKQRRRLSSSSVEDRRDAVLQLGWIARPESSRVAATALTDRAVAVRVAAAKAVLSLPPSEAVLVLLPALRDRNDLVRRDVAYALGETRHASAVPALSEALLKDRQPGVRGAAAVALGLIGDESAVGPLIQALNSSLARRSESNEFVQRSASIALGQIGNRSAVPALITALQESQMHDDVRRAAAEALGMIGDPASVPALRTALTARDPYLALAAFEALRKLAPEQALKPL